MQSSLTTFKNCHQQIHLGSVSNRQATTRLTNTNVDIYKIALIVKKLTYSFKDVRCILPAWNCQPALFNFHGSIERIIDAKYLAAIHRLNHIQANGLSISEKELYYVWLLFLKENRGLTTNLFSLQTFSEFQKTWKFIDDNQIDENILKDESNLEVDDWKEVSIQLNINYNKI